MVEKAYEGHVLEPWKSSGFNFCFYICSHLYKCILKVSIKVVPFGVKGLIVSISINFTLPRARLTFALPLTPATDTVRQSTNILVHYSFISFFEKTSWKVAIPGFAAGFDTLSCTEYFPIVHTGAVFQRDTVSKMVMWAVTATITGHTDPLGYMKKGESLNSRTTLTDQPKATSMTRKFM